MIREINSELTEQPYVNIIELVYMFIIVELHVAMSTIKLFDMESKTWNVRRLFWYTAIGMPSIFIRGIFVLAAVKYLLQ